MRSEAAVLLSVLAILIDLVRTSTQTDLGPKPPLELLPQHYQKGVTFAELETLYLGAFEPHRLVKHLLPAIVDRTHLAAILW